MEVGQLESGRPHLVMKHSDYFEERGTDAVVNPEGGGGVACHAVACLQAARARLFWLGSPAGVALRRGSLTADWRGARYGFRGVLVRDVLGFRSRVVA